MASLEGKVIALTGAASGIGNATAKLLASRGATLSLADVNGEALTRAAQELSHPERHICHVVDVRSASAVNDWILATVEVLGPLDGAANIAGVLGAPKKVRELTDDEWDFVMDINTKGVFNCMRAQLQHMKTDGGSIVNFASIAALVALQNHGVYTASKHAVLGLSRAAARDEGERGIRVNCVAPGMTRTPIVDGISEEELRRRTKRYQCVDRIADPVEVGNVVAFLLSDESKFVTGTCYEVSGGWTA